MATRRTEATELSVGFGILGINDPSTPDLPIHELFENTLENNIYCDYLREYVKDLPTYSRFINCGQRLRNGHFQNVQSIRWTGGQQQAATSMVSEDLFIPSYNMPISIKNESNVVANLSPHNLFRCLPNGEVQISQGSDWFIEKDYQGLQSLYLYARNLYYPISNLPSDVSDYYQEIPKAARKKFQNFIGTLMGDDLRGFTELYTNMCRRVAQTSAEELMNHLGELNPKSRTAVHENIIKQFFRVNHVPYVLTGIDRGNGFAARIPNITAWKHYWQIQSIQTGVISGGQSMVGIKLNILNKNNHSIHPMDFRVEIRWSHGKFCGNPESKLYKVFSWEDVPFFEKLF